MEHSQIQSSETIYSNEETEQTHMLILPYQRKQGNCGLRKPINSNLPEKKKAQIIYTGTKLGNKFNIKDVNKKEHKHDLIYSVNCPLKLLTKVTMVKMEG